MTNINFINTYQIEHKLCDSIIDFYNKNLECTIKGLVTNRITRESEIDNDIKESRELLISATHLYEPMHEYRKYLQSFLDNYLKTYSEVNSYSKFNIVEDYNIQHYCPGGGFKKWHFENDSRKNINRILVFMTFLNDVPDGGTNFKYQNLTIPAKKGSTIIWPAAFTHTHKGQISYTREKYIVTGWWSLINE